MGVCFYTRRAAGVKENLPLIESHWEVNASETSCLVEEGRRDSLRNAQPTDVTHLNFTVFFFLDFIYLLERESTSVLAGGREGQRERGKISRRLPTEHGA